MALRAIRWRRGASVLLISVFATGVAAAGPVYLAAAADSILAYTLRTADPTATGTGMELTQDAPRKPDPGVAVARALAIEPDVVLADEPTAELDAVSRQQVLHLLTAWPDAGRTVVIATHDPDVAARCDRRIEVAAGRIVS